MTPILANILDVVSWIIVIPVAAGLGYRAFAKSENREALAARWAASLFLCFAIWVCSRMKTPLKALFMLIPCALLGFMWIRTVMGALIRPLTNAFDGGETEVDPAPFYFLAEGKRRNGLFQEAIAEVEKQLERFPHDQTGIMLRATIEAEDLHDIPAAQATVERLLRQSEAPPQAAVAALHALADWQLQAGNDVPGARASLERIVQMFPNTQVAHAAEQRLAHLDGTAAVRQARENVKYVVKPRDAGPPVAPASQENDPDGLAAQYVKQLERFPNDTSTREKLAVLYAEQFQRLDLAAAQIAQLTALPNETPKHIANWFNLLATLYIKYGNDLRNAEVALHRIIERFPKSALANIALARLGTLQGELKAADRAEVKHLGSYEKDLGLKKSAI